MSIGGQNAATSFNKRSSHQPAMMMAQNSSVRSNVAAVPNTRRNKNATIMASEFYGEAEDFFVEGDGPVDVKEDHFKTSNLKDMTNLERVQHA